MSWRRAPATLNVMTTKSLLLTEFGGSVSADVDAPADEAFWRRALLGKLRRRQMGDEVPDSLRALAALLAPA